MHVLLEFFTTKKPEHYGYLILPYVTLFTFWTYFRLEIHLMEINSVGEKNTLELFAEI